MSDKLKPLNLYRSNDDRDIWDRVDKLAKQSGKSASKVITACVRKALRMEEDEDAGTAQAPTVEVVGARIPVETVEYSNATIRLDVSGNVVAVEFKDKVFVE